MKIYKWNTPFKKSWILTTTEQHKNSKMRICNFVCVSEVTNVEIDMERQRVYVTSSLPSDKLLEIIKKTGKTTSYVGTA